MDSCEEGNEPFGSIKDKEFLEQLNNFQLLKRSSAMHSSGILSTHCL